MCSFVTENFKFGGAPITKTVWSFGKQLFKSFSSYLLAKLYVGNDSRTLQLVNAYSTLPSLAWKKASPPNVGREQLVDLLS
jgi:hypothetical protein